MVLSISCQDFCVEFFVPIFFSFPTIFFKMVLPPMLLPDWLLEFISGDTEDMMLQGFRIFAIVFQVLLMVALVAVYVWNCTSARNANTDKTLPAPKPRTKNVVRFQDDKVKFTDLKRRQVAEPQKAS